MKDLINDNHEDLKNSKHKKKKKGIDDGQDDSVLSDMILSLSDYDENDYSSDNSINSNENSSDNLSEESIDEDEIDDMFFLDLSKKDELEKFNMNMTKEKFLIRKRDEYCCKCVIIIYYH
jgi:hypothetical protein